MKSPHSKQILCVAATVGIIFTLQGCGGGSPPGCTLSGSFEKFEGSCTIPDSTTITSECCNVIQGNIDRQGKMPTPSEKQEMMKKCSSFQNYMMKRIPHGVPSPPQSEQDDINMIKALPDGLTCTEKIKGGGESACELNAKHGKLAVTCEIPKETTITSECCIAIQGGIDKVQAQPNVLPSPQEKQEMMNKCASVQNYMTKLMPRQTGGPPPNPAAPMHMPLQTGGALQTGGPPPNPAGGPNPAAIINSLPSGLSCTETASSGNMLSLYANRTIISAISLAAGVGSKDVSDKASVMPSVVSGIAGFMAGGMLVAGVLLRYSTKQQGNQQALLAGPEVA